ncbi:hypothetical protein CXG81DRAFT_21451 [Caulochytrium protostelioides]|uniref:Uncharacterized protein n=1 Tax=Caulochytrium protostelioides TaxID=1555241 RepID=A0A4P9X213_9FUNG|nr:hypothetical protein CXG81DRAFT_21451 [Caulochytrium protostelioides]|eukprot:RKO98300.1 hypothetical protein CXG81DRAFT_21451 [Caulochytrium protostelioides]
MGAFWRCSGLLLVLIVLIAGSSSAPMNLEPNPTSAGGFKYFGQHERSLPRMPKSLQKAPLVQETAGANARVLSPNRHSPKLEDIEYPSDYDQNIRHAASSLNIFAPLTEEINVALAKVFFGGSPQISVSGMWAAMPILESRHDLETSLYTVRAGLDPLLGRQKRNVADPRMSGFQLSYDRGLLDRYLAWTVSKERCSELADFMDGLHKFSSAIDFWAQDDDMLDRQTMVKTILDMPPLTLAALLDSTSVPAIPEAEESGRLDSETAREDEYYLLKGSQTPHEIPSEDLNRWLLEFLPKLRSFTVLPYKSPVPLDVRDVRGRSAS